MASWTLLLLIFETKRLLWYLQHSISVLFYLENTWKDEFDLFEETEFVHIWTHGKFNPYLWVIVVNFLCFR